MNRFLKSNAGNYLCVGVPTRPLGTRVGIEMTPEFLIFEQSISSIFLKLVTDNIIPPA